jgi:hypothetical protein
MRKGKREGSLNEFCFAGNVIVVVVNDGEGLQKDVRKGGRKED